MTVYVLSGKLGSGKTLAAIDKMRTHVRKGLRVATNIDLNLEHLVNARNQNSVYRVPDHPKAEDLEQIGKGCEEYDEDKFGLLVLDEAGTWLNARSWSGNGRQDLIGWLLHARKLRWHVILIVQHHSLLDKQVRDSLVEMYGNCRRMDRVKVPGMPFKLPKMHLCVVTYGTQQHALVAERWWYRSADLYQAYDTGQIFEASNTAPHCMLSAWHVKGRYQKPRPGLSFFLLLPVRLAFIVTALAFELFGIIKRSDWYPASQEKPLQLQASP